MEKKKSNRINNSAPIAYKKELWQMADALRGSMDAAEYYWIPKSTLYKLAQ